MGPSDADYDEESRVGATLGLGAWYARDERRSYGLVYERTNLGHFERFDVPNSILVDAVQSSLMLGLRVVPREDANIRSYVSLRVGINWVSLDATGTRAASDVTQPGVPFQCSESGDVGLSLGAGAGAEIDLGNGWVVVPEARGTAHQGSTEVLGTCAVAPGTTVNLSAALGLGYRFRTSPL